MWTTINQANAALTRNGWTRSAAERWTRTTDAGTVMIRSDWHTVAGSRRLRLAVTLDGRPLCDLGVRTRCVGGVLYEVPMTDAEIVADIDAAIRGGEMDELQERRPTTLYDYAKLSKSWVAEDDDVLEFVPADPAAVRRVPMPADAGPDEPILISVLNDDGSESTLRLNGNVFLPIG